MNGFWNVKDWIQKRMKNRSRADYFIMILLGVLVMIVAIPTDRSGRKQEEKSEPIQEEENVQAITEREYIEQQEEELRELLEHMEGVGKCRVMLTLDDGQTYVDKNVVSADNRYEESTVIYDTGDGEKPYVIKEERPKVAGVAVVAEGGGNAVVVSNISRAVMSLFQLEVHKITVVKMSVQEE